MKRRPTLKLFLLLFITSIPLLAIWALANPMFASPDEPAHMVRAQGAVRGDFKEPYLTDGVPTGAVTCMSFQWDISADCMDLTWSDASSPRFSTTDTYPPMFHFIAGIPSLFFERLTGAYVMRLWMASVCAALFALAGTILLMRNASRWTVAALAMSTTPMVVFTMATVNPSGITAALSALLWASGLSLCRPGLRSPSGLTKVAFIGTVVLFPLLRRDALAWEIVVLAVLVVLAGRRRLAELRRDRALTTAFIVAVLNMAWVWFSWSSTATDSFVSNSAVHGGGSWASGFGSLYTYLLQMIGWFGWLDSPMTSETFVLLIVALATFVILGVTADKTTERRGAILLLFGIIIIPTLIGAVRFPYVQGRYLFPIFIGLMFLIGHSIATADLPRQFQRRIFSVLMGILALVHFFAFAQNLRRYTVGRTGTWRFFTEARWHPPMMSNLTAIILAIGAILLSVFCYGRVVSGLESGMTFDSATDVEAVK